MSLAGIVHGCYHELQTLLDNVGYNPSSDRLAFVGDLVNKGPASLRVLRFVKNLVESQKADCVVGNHEIKVLEGVSDEPWSRNLSPEDVTFIENLPSYIEYPKSLRHPDSGELVNVIMVHAGVIPGIPIGEQALSTLTTIRSIKPDGTADESHKYPAWIDAYKGPDYIVYGHDASWKEMLRPFSHGIDGACYKGKKLLALEFPRGTVHSVKCPTDYSLLSQRELHALYLADNQASLDDTDLYAEDILQRF